MGPSSPARRQGRKLRAEQPFTPGETVSANTNQKVRGATAGRFQLTVADSGRQNTVRAVHGRHAPAATCSASSCRGPTRARGGRRDRLVRGVGGRRSCSWPRSGSGAGAGRGSSTRPGGSSGSGSRFRDAGSGGLPGSSATAASPCSRGGRGTRRGAGGENVIWTALSPVATVEAGDGLTTTCTSSSSPQGPRWSPLTSRSTGMRRPSNGAQQEVMSTGSSRRSTSRPVWCCSSGQPRPRTLSDTYAQLPQAAPHPFDYFHVNSVELDSDGNLVISGRNTWAAYKAITEPGRCDLDARRQALELQDGPGTAFAFQHDVRVPLERRSVR